VEEAISAVEILVAAETLGAVISVVAEAILAAAVISKHQASSVSHADSTVTSDPCGELGLDPDGLRARKSFPGRGSTSAAHPALSVDDRGGNNRSSSGDLDRRSRCPQIPLEG
jgi:hypothetical protein